MDASGCWGRRHRTRWSLGWRRWSNACPTAKGLENRVVGRLRVVVVVEKERGPLTGEDTRYPGVWVSNAPHRDIVAARDRQTRRYNLAVVSGLLLKVRATSRCRHADVKFSDLHIEAEIGEAL